MRRAVALGPLLLVVGIAGVAVVATRGPLPLLAGFICLAGLGIGPGDRVADDLHGG